MFTPEVFKVLFTTSAAYNDSLALSTNENINIYGIIVEGMKRTAVWTTVHTDGVKFIHCEPYPLVRIVQVLQFSCQLDTS